MQVTKKDLEKSQIELTVEFSVEEFQPYIEKGAAKVSEKVKIEGFRPGKAPLEVLKAKVGEMSIMEEAANIAIRKTIDDIIEQNTIGTPAVGQPKVEITKLAPGNPVELKIIVSIMPKVALGDYKGLKIKPTEAKVEEADIEKTLKELQEMRVKEVITEDAVGDGDKVLVDIEMFMEKVPLEGGQTKGLAVIIGKNYFVAGFDKNLIGAKKGDDRDFSLPFPADHHQQNLAGKMVDFKVKVQEVYKRELPEINDEFAVSFRFENLADLRKAMSDNILADRTNSANQKTEIEMLEAIIAKTKFGEIPEQLVESETHHMLHEIEDNLTKQGSKMADYLQHLNKTKDQFVLDLVPSALKRVKTALIMKEIAVVEKIDISEETVDNKIAAIKEEHKHDKSLDGLATDMGYRRYLANVLQNEQVLNKLKEWNYADSGKK